MKFFSKLFVFFFFFFLQIFSSHSQETDSCSSPLKLKNQLLFETSKFHCVSVWGAQGYILRYMQTDTKVWSFVLSAPNSNAYIGMGFSSNGKMVGSSAIVGWVNSNGTPSMKRYFLGAQSEEAVVPDQGNLELVNFTSSMVSENSRIYMAFQLNIDMPSNRLIYSLGPIGRLPSGDNRLSEHRDKIATFLDYSTGQSETTTLYAKLRRAHGLLNMFGWGILISIGAMVARYLRQYDPIWFYAHTAIQSLAFLLGFAGIVCGFVLEDRLATDVDRHKAIGIFVLVLGCLQVIALLARPDKESKVRKYWNWYHYTLGRVLIVLAAVNVFYGIHLGNAGSSWVVGFAVALAVLYVTATILEIRMWIKK